MAPDPANRLTRWGLPALLLLFVTLATVYNITTPIFEASDELYHYPFVRYVATEYRLPVQDPGDVQLWRQEGSQPPLYYIISAAATAWIDTKDFDRRLVRNPQAKIGIPLAPDNKNMVIHTPDEAFPYRGTTLAVHIIRFLSTLMGAGTVALTFFIVREVWPDSALLPLVAAATVAFNPMHLFITASVNNDNLTILLCSLALWQIVRLLRWGATPRRVAGIGVVVGLATLTKMSALGLVFLVALAITVDVWHRRSSFKTWLGYGLLAASLVAAIGGWWYVRNWLLYDDPMGFSAWLAIAGVRLNTPSPADLLAEFEGFRISYWGLLGGVNLLIHPFLYKVYDALTVLAVIGLLVGGIRWGASHRGQAWRRVLADQYPRIAQIAVLGLWPLILLAALVRWTLMTPASQGRLIFPAIAAISFWLALGWQHLVPKRLSRVTLTAVVAALLIVAIAVPPAFIAPAYAQPSAIDAAEVRAYVSHETNLVFQDQVTLLGYQVEGESVGPGEEVWVRACWQGNQDIQDNYRVFVQVLVDNDLIAAQEDTFHGSGNFPTSLWPAGVVFCDRYPLQIAETVPAPGPTEIAMGLYRASGARLPVSSADGEPPSDQIRFPGPDIIFPEEGRTLAFNWAQQIRLIDYELDTTAVRPGETLEISLTWSAAEPISKDYAATVQIFREGGEKIGQNDTRLPTSTWQVDARVTDLRTIMISPEAAAGVYQIKLGVYDPETVSNLALYRERELTPAGGLLDLWTLRVVDR